MRSNGTQITDLTSDLKEETPLDIIVQDKLDVVRKRYKELDDNCKDYFRNYENLVSLIGSYNYILADKALDFELRLDVEKKVEPLIKSQKEDERKYERQKHLRTRIYSILQSIDNLNNKQSVAERYKAQADMDLKEVARLQQSAKRNKGKWEYELRKIEESLDHLWSESESEEFVG